MQDPKTVLEVLSKFNGNVDNIYRNLYNPEFYKIAYQNIGSKPSQMTKASDDSTIDGMSLDRIDNIIESLRNKTYEPTDLRRVSIPKKSGGERKISIPSVKDKLIQEVIRMLLEAIYDHTFSESSHGFRSKRSCHTALNYIVMKGTGTKWWIDADIKGCFDNINHQILLKILSERIKEQKFLNLINKFLKAGYLENWKYHKTYSGVPQGSIIGPILCNIYLDKLDKHIEELARDFNKGKQRKLNPEYQRIHAKTQRRKKKLENNRNEENQKDYELHRKEELRILREKGAYLYDDPNFRRITYVRYADDFVVGVIASKEETQGILEDITTFLKEKLGLEINKEKTKTTNNKDKIKFLGYELSVMKSESRKTVNGKIGLWVPYKVMIDYIIQNRFGKFIQNQENGKAMLYATHRTELINLTEIEIINQYNDMMRGLYNYYKLASNVCKLNGFNYICQMSFLKTLAAKYKTSCKKLYKDKRYCQNKHIGITFNGNFKQFFNGPFNVVKTDRENTLIDIKPNLHKYFARTSLIDRINATKCDICGTEEGPFEVHHVKKLKDLKGKSNWERLMIARRRKTISLCINCHDKLHAGKL